MIKHSIMPPIDPNNRPIPQVRPINRAPAEPLSSTPYDFIINPSVTPPKKSWGGFKGGPKLTYIAGGGVLLVILLFVVLSLTRGSSSTPELVTVAQQQTELARVADLHYSDIQDVTTKNFAINTELSLESAQATYLKYLSSKGAGIDAKKLTLGMNSRTDTALDAAKASGALDSTVKSTLQSGLETYQQTIQAAYTNASSPETKALLKNMYDQVKLLLEQSKL